MSDQQIGRKMIEEEDVRHFLAAYARVTGYELQIIKSGERPDFICEDQYGRSVGVEITRIDLSSHKYIIDAIDKSVSKKTSLIDKEWKEIGNTILALQLLDERMEEIKTLITNDVQEDFVSKYFSEIWVADYSGLEAYGDIELFGLHPPKWRGYHKRNNPNRKPFG